LAAALPLQAPRLAAPTLAAALPLLAAALPQGITLLTNLAIHNFAIIRDLEMCFHAGFNVLSGETGAGKSILVGAVNLVLGARASSDMIRTGAGEASVEAVMLLPPESPCRRYLRQWDIDAGPELVVRRSIARSGRNRVFINDQTASVQQLQQLSPLLISISGQHEHQRLLDPETHLGLLDCFANLDTACSEVREVHAAWQGRRDALAQMKRARERNAAEMDFLRFQVGEIEAAKIQRDEDTELAREREILKNAATLSSASQAAVSALYSEKGSILERISEVDKVLESICAVDEAQRELGEYLQQARIHLEELTHALRQYADRIVFDPQRLAFIEDRLALLGRLGKKYGRGANEMLERLEELREMAGKSEESNLREEELGREAESLRLAYLEKAGALSLKRREAAARLSTEVTFGLAGLDMPNARFGTHFYDRDEDPPLFSPTGLDRIEFLLSANPGEDLKPLAKVASGGELSRILLALKTLVGGKEEAETLVFDEVDAGIGGRTAELVGVQLKKLSERHQVICITHLPQIACYGKWHYLVRKKADGNETATTIRILTEPERTEELARMLGGISISKRLREHAKELLERSSGTQGG
jgi:DNA repair protein RecN (Recombination protein N)